MNDVRNTDQTHLPVSAAITRWEARLADAANGSFRCHVSQQLKQWLSQPLASRLLGYFHGLQFCPSIVEATVTFKIKQHLIVLDHENDTWNKPSTRICRRGPRLATYLSKTENNTFPTSLDWQTKGPIDERRGGRDNESLRTTPNSFTLHSMKPLNKAYSLCRAVGLSIRPDLKPLKYLFRSLVLFFKFLNK